MSSINLVKYLC